MRPLKKHSFVSLGLAVTVIASVVLAPFHAQAARQEEEHTERWRKAEKEIEHNGFSEQFKDSLVQAKDVSHVKALRQIETPLFLKKEKFVLEARWGPIKAGYGIMEYQPDTARNLLNLSAKVVTSRFVGALFRVRDYVCSTIDAGGIYPIFFQEHIEEGRYRAKRWVLYDQEKRLAYTNKKKYERVEIPPFSHDFMSLLYFVRSMELAPGDTFSVDCFAHGKNYSVFFRCGNKRKRITVDAGTYDCISVRLRLGGEGRNFSKRDKLTLWMTDDERHIPVVIKSKIKVGSVVAKLIYYE